MTCHVCICTFCKEFIMTVFFCYKKFKLLFIIYTGDKVEVWQRTCLKTYFYEIYKNILPFGLKFHEDTAPHAFWEHLMGKYHSCTSWLIYIFEFIYMNNYLICLFTGRNFEVSNIVRYEVLAAILSKIWVPWAVVMYWLVNNNQCLGQILFFDCMEPEDGGSTLSWNVDKIQETKWHYILEDMKLLLLSHDLLIICVLQGIGAYCYVLMAFNWIWDPSGCGTCVSSE